MKEKAIILEEKDMERALTRIAHEILEKNKGTQDLVLVGIKMRGDDLAYRLAKKISSIENLSSPLPVGALDITFYRDDLSSKPSKPAQTTQIPFNLEGKKVVLVDDVLYTGRSVRAAMTALLDFGRPAWIQLAVLVDRGHREFPIHADYIGKNLPTAAREEVKVYTKETDSIDKVVIAE